MHSLRSRVVGAAALLATLCNEACLLLDYGVPGQVVPGLDASTLDASVVDAGAGERERREASVDASGSPLDPDGGRGDGSFESATECVGLDACAPSCGNGQNCALRCEGAGRCTPSCASGGDCIISCIDTQSCAIRCHPGAKCVITCDNSDCSELQCPTGAHCELRSCTHGATCP